MDLQNESKEEMALDAQAGSEVPDIEIYYANHARWEQSMLLKMHRNLGHPAPERLSQALQSAGYRAEVVQAAHDIKCPTCMKCSPPKAPRPAHLKPMMDFNHKIYLDGVT
jgi:hypothetical protein